MQTARQFYVVSDADGPRYTVKYGTPGAISVPVATTTHRGMAERIAAALQQTASVSGVSAPEQAASGTRAPIHVVKPTEGEKGKL